MFINTNVPENSPNDFKKLSKKEQKILVQWINENLTKTKGFCKEYSSYYLKHVFERDKIGFYITNGMFKGAMIEAGFKIRNKNDVNSFFNVSAKSITKIKEIIL